MNGVAPGGAFGTPIPLFKTISWPLHVDKSESWFQNTNSLDINSIYMCISHVVIHIIPRLFRGMPGVILWGKDKVKKRVILEQRGKEEKRFDR